MRDNHLHTHFSYDCQTDFRDYLDHFSGEIVTTEHFDLSNPYMGGPRDDVPDDEAYSREIEKLTARYGHRIKRGIEIGYYAPRLVDILSFLEGKDYDLKLLSVHHNGKFDYLEEEVFQHDKDEIIKEYLISLEEAIERVPAHVLAHFDYGFRKLHLSVDDLQKHESCLIRIFQKMIAHDLAFELNTKSMYLYGNEALYRYALSLLKDLGCRKYSVGSDGHCLEHFRFAFDKIEHLLEEFGISEKDLIGE